MDNCPVILVSEPQRLVLTRDTAHHNHESTLVEPLLPVARITYFRCLVDAGPRFEEHVVVVEQEGTTSPSAREVIARALTAARATTVTFIATVDRKTNALNKEGLRAAAAGLAASAVCSLSKDRQLGPNKSESVAWTGLVVSRRGQFYACEPIAS